MNEKNIFNAINQTDDKFITETLSDIEQRKAKSSNRKASFSKAIAACLAVITVLCTGTAVAAAVSSEFREWINSVFEGNKIVKIADMSEDIALKDNMQIVGNNESFVEEYKFNDDSYETVENVYCINKDKLQLLDKHTFKGVYKGKSYSFEYSTIGNEIDGYNYKGNIDEVFHYKNGDLILALLSDEKSNTQAIAEIDLKENKTKILTEHYHQTNALMSPQGKVILLNYRAEGYWTVYDVNTNTERKVEGINGYAHTNEIYFINDYKIAAIGEPTIKGNTEHANTNVIDLKTLKMVIYPDYGDINACWNYELKGTTLKFYNILDKTEFSIQKIEAKYVSTVTARDNYILLCDDNWQSYYLCNLKEQNCMKIDIPKQLQEDIEIYLTVKDNKILLSDNKTVYLIDLK